MNKKIVMTSVLALAGATLGATTQVEAGSKWTYAVQVNTGGQYALGALGTVRNTSDTTQMIGCWVYAYGDGSPSMAFCGATTSTGVSASCSTSNPEMVAMAAALDGDALLRFDWDGGLCTGFIVQKSSIHAPKLP
jgi:hypothetical protein